jgi:Phage integrase, N-terminal SAM-like domain
MILRRKQADGTTRYAVRVNRAGKQLWVGTFQTIADARKAEAQARVERDSGAMTCDEYADFWLEGYRERVRDSSYTTAESSLRAFKVEFKGIPLVSVTPIEAEKWARKNRSKALTVNTMMNAALESELIRRNPFKGKAGRTKGRSEQAPPT